MVTAPAEKLSRLIAHDRSSVFLVEDHAVSRAGYLRVIEQDPSLEVCGEAGSANEAFTVILQSPPDVVIMDIGLRSGNGLELIKNLKTIHSRLKVLVISMHDELVYAERALRAGASGYLMKSESLNAVIAAIKQVLSGELYLSDKMKQRLVQKSLGQLTRESDFPLDALTDRELEVYHLTGNGFTTREIAARINLSAKTVDSYRENIKYKLRLGNSAELSRHAIRWVRLDSQTGA